MNHKLGYLVAETGPRNYVFDSRTGQSHDRELNDKRDGKRTLLLDYIEETKANIISICCMYEYVLPTNRAQLVCWFTYEDSGDKGVQQPGQDQPILFGRVLP